MEDSQALIAIVGKGHGGGVKVRTEPYDPRLGLVVRSAPTAGTEFGDASGAGDAAARLRDSWALAGGLTKLSAGAGLTIKISRHVDGSGCQWGWVGLYRPARFNDDPREGFYFGAGLAFRACPPPAALVEFLNQLFGQARRLLFRGEEMAIGVHELEIPRLELPRLDLRSSLVPDRGLNPWASQGRFVVLPGMDGVTIAEQIGQAFESPAYNSHSILYLTDSGGPSPPDFHVPVEADRPRYRASPDPPAEALETTFAPSPLAYEFPRAERFDPPLPPRRPSADADPQERTLAIMKDVQKRVRNLEDQLRSTLERLAPETPPAAASDRRATAILDRLAKIVLWLSVAAMLTMGLLLLLRRLNLT